eukprot:scaffold14435_cov266-Ochromonas_danica.AAC.2
MLLPYEELGNEEGPVMVLLSGFPDSLNSAWHPKIIETLARQYHLFVISVPLTPPNPVTEDTKCFQSLLDNFNHTLRAAGALSSQSNANPSCPKRDSQKLGGSIILMAHGIGCLLALLYENRFPSDIERLLCCDLLDPQPSFHLACYHHLTIDSIDDLSYGEDKRVMLHDDEFIWSIESYNQRTACTDADSRGSIAFESESHENGSKKRNQEAIYLRQHRYSYDPAEQRIVQVTSREENPLVGNGNASRVSETEEASAHLSISPSPSSGGCEGHSRHANEKRRGKDTCSKSRYLGIPKAGHHFSRTHPDIILAEVQSFVGI